MITYAIQAALESNLFQRVLVSTDDIEIAEVACKAGAETEMRPPELATDKARVKDVCLHVLDQEEAQGRSYDVMFCIYATAPLIKSADIANIAGMVTPGVSDFVMAVTTYPFPPHQAMRMDENGILKPMWPEIASRQSQDMCDLYIDNGSIYAVTVDAFRIFQSFRGAGVRGYFMPLTRSVDIDTPEDLELALYFASKMEL